MKFLQEIVSICLQIIFKHMSHEGRTVIQIKLLVLILKENQSVSLVLDTFRRRI